MESLWTEFLKAITPFVRTFIPIFVAVDVIGMIPLYTGLTGQIPKNHRSRIAGQSIVTALIISIAFLFVGKTIFEFLGITVEDFQIAGGVLLFVLAVVDLIGGKTLTETTPQMGVVPLGTPLIIGPAVLTVLIMMLDLYGIWPTLAGILLNLGLVALALFNAERILSVMGESGAKGTAKVVSLLLAAIGVMMVRRGIVSIIFRLGAGS
jgi:multiple antibiotic resistance protein